MKSANVAATEAETAHPAEIAASKKSAAEAAEKVASINKAADDAEAEAEAEAGQAKVDSNQPLTRHEADDALANLKIWHAVDKTDPAYTKPFQRFGGFKGTAVNATYLARCATEVFGSMGIGWGLEILDESMMEGAPLDDRGTRELIHKLRVKLWYKQGGQTGEVVQFGLTTFVGRNKFGLFTDEEAPKKSLTDAMSKCLSLLGFSADVYLGQFDDSKYLQEISAEFDIKRRDEKRRRQPVISAIQVDALDDLLYKTGTDHDKFLSFFEIQSLSNMPASCFDRAKQMLDRKLSTPA